MRLIDVARPNTTPTAGWRQMTPIVARECGVWIRLTDPCEDTSVDVTGDTTSRSTVYNVLPWAAEAILQRSTECARADDEAWLEKALEDYNDFLLSRALVLLPITGTQSYLGHTDVHETTLTATSDATLADSVMAARKYWFKHVAGVGDRPLMHIPPSLAPALGRGGVITQNVDKNIAGDTIVMSEGYDEITSPRVFFTGKVETWVSSTGTNTQTDHRINEVITVINELLMVKVAPCSIVRVGSYAA